MLERPTLLISKRLQQPDVKTKGNEGGLVEALKGMKGRRLGWDGKTTAGPVELTRRVVDGVEYNTFPIPEALAANFSRAKNVDDWGEAHGVVIGVPSSQMVLDAVHVVHRIYASQIARIISPVDIARVDDFQLEGVAAAARWYGIRNPFGYQRHIPVPYVDAISAPTSRMMRAVLEDDLVCVQVPEDIVNLVRIAEQQWGARQIDVNHLQIGHRLVRLAAIPATIRFDDIAGRDYSPENWSKQTRDLFQRIGDQEIVLGLDRLDPAKGLVPKFRGFERYLEKHPDRLGKVVLLQFAPDSRMDLPEYIAHAKEVHREAERINKRFGRTVIILEGAIPGDQKHHFLRAADITLLTPMRDGMNLVAKEQVAAQDGSNPHVLILSKFAGSARELSQALLVKPNSYEDIAKRLEDGFAMLPEERVVRWEHQKKAVLAFQPRDYQLAFDTNMGIVAETMLARSTNALRSVLATNHASSLGVSQRRGKQSLRL